MTKWTYIAPDEMTFSLYGATASLGTHLLASLYPPNDIIERYYGRMYGAVNVSSTDKLYYLSIFLRKVYE